MSTMPPARSSQHAPQHRDTYSAYGASEADRWEQKWREGVDEALRSISVQQQDTALVLARVADRLSVLEGKPNEDRARFAVTSQAAVTIIAMCALFVSLVSVILAHVTFH